MSETAPTSEALMTDPTTEEGQAYWAERNRLEQWAEVDAVTLPASAPLAPRIR